MNKQTWKAVTTFSRISLPSPRTLFNELAKSSHEVVMIILAERMIELDVNFQRKIRAVHGLALKKYVVSFYNPRDSRGLYGKIRYTTTTKKEYNFLYSIVHSAKIMFLNVAQIPICNLSRPRAQSFKRCTIYRYKTNQFSLH
jgi:hypothetical protein